MIFLSGYHDIAFRDRDDTGIMLNRWNGRRSREKMLGYTWGMDTMSFTRPEKFRLDSYLAFLKRKSIYQDKCLFATAPDVLGDVDATIDKAMPVLPLIRDLGYSAALVAQNGIEHVDIDWDAFDVWFVGGTTDWKLSSPSYELMQEARLKGKKVHMGRVNTFRRLKSAATIGCHSVDGNRAIFKPRKEVPYILYMLDKLKQQPVMCL